MSRAPVPEPVPAGEIVTVLGPVPAASFGPTLMHEHVLCDLTPVELRGANAPEVEITLANRHAVDYRPNLHLGNHRLTARAVAAAELAALRAAGGSAVVDLTTGGIAPDPAGLAEAARESGVHVVLGAGFYCDAFVDDATRARDAGWLAETVERQLVDGAWGTTARCGIIGEVGCSWPLTPFERRSLAAAGRAARRTGAAINVHPGRHPDAPHEILDLLEREGADPARVVISHVDRTYFDYASIRALAARGCVVEFDFFGIETSTYWFGVADLPTDWMRLRYVRQLIEDGFLDRILLSQDICTRTRLARFGGHGYGHLFANVVPMMRERGFVASEIERLLVATPRRLLVRA
jgi:phosphotriesterase-related protein